jgi:hypothetical protein
MMDDTMMAPRMVDSKLLDRSTREQCQRKVVMALLTRLL